MKNDQAYSRRDFLRTSALLAGGFLTLPSFLPAGRTPKLAFSTLGCPDWEFNRITAFAREQGYKGIEVRGILREMDLPKSPVFSSASGRSATMVRMKELGLRFVGLGSSSTLHYAGAAERKKQLDDGRRFIDLAAAIDCPYVRVFPNNFPKDQEKQQTMELISQGLHELATYAKGAGVTVLMETHGDLVWADDLLQIMKMTNHKQAALVWDPSNMWTVTKEDPAAVLSKLKPYIRHVHVKDARLLEGKLQYTFLGQGDVPIFQAIDLLAREAYDGYYSFEWEKLWHPEIAEPELALAHYPKVMKKHFQ